MNNNWMEAIFEAAREGQAVALSRKKVGIDAIAQRMNMQGLARALRFILRGHTGVVNGCANAAPVLTLVRDGRLLSQLYGTTR
jgi:hypothetical protein